MALVETKAVCKNKNNVRYYCANIRLSKYSQGNIVSALSVFNPI
jgi:hypothetical protein